MTDGSILPNQVNFDSSNLKLGVTNDGNLLPGVMSFSLFGQVADLV